ncbi:nucleoside triphosphate pyrophosphohydrolase [Pseudoxanthomonas phage PW916]|nr:nucleoside triphosphate pyrophosphohydrolase [Pseudoxanthomonas phage PW916]
MQNDEKPPVEDRGTLASGFTPDAEFHTIPSSKEFEDVFNFHAKFDLLRFEKPGHLTKGKLRERIEFMQEELNEFVEGCGLVTMENSDSPGIPVLSYEDDGEQDLAKQADALVDLVYVALGTAVMLGLPWDWLWNDVQRANMAKVRGMTKRGHAVDVTKPPGWQGPQTQRILDLAGYNPNEEHRDDTQR